MMYGNMAGAGWLLALIWIVAVGAVVVALWRGMQAQEKIAAHLEGIERALRERSGSV
jgi:hypothetical protein